MLVAASLAVIAAYWVKELGRQDDLLRVQRDPPPIDFLVDVNSAPWTELSLLPGVGETLAKRIVESRAADGPFREHDDVLRVRGIGPKTLERMRPYLTPMPDFDSVAGP
ncbi:MAG: helix-hairpin-helix domain-containing protein [Planctomycetes bacterium]|nr:helix-hairpin-helix domain-containing protein [Planctomycetota bacterium]